MEVEVSERFIQRQERDARKCCLNLSKRTRRNIFGIAAVLLLLTFVCLMYQVYDNNGFKGSKNSHNLDESGLTKPCHDFHAYACRSASALRGETSFSFVRNTHDKELDVILRKKQLADNEAEKKAKTFFKSCVHNLDKPDDGESTSRLEFLEKMKQLSNLQEKLEFLQNDYGLSPLFRWTVQLDFKNSDRYIIQLVSNQQLFMDLNPETMKQLMEIFFENEELEEILKIHKKIWEPLDINESCEDQSIPLNQLDKIAGFLNWTNFFNNAFEKVNNVKVNQNQDKISVSCPIYFEKLSENLKKLQKDDQELYNSSAFDAYLLLQSALEIVGYASISSSSNGCIALTKMFFPYAVTSLYVKNNNASVSIESINQVKEMAENIRSITVQVLQESQWLDQDSKMAAVEKTKGMTVLVGYPNFIMDTQLLDEYYRNLEPMNETDFEQNVDYILIFRRRESCRRFGQPVDASNWPHLDFALDPVPFHLFGNIVVVPIGVMHLPFFQHGSPPYLNYGSLGAMIGHEIFHGFERTGSLFDKNGQFLEEGIWNTNATRREVEKRHNCLIEQYSEFKHKDGTAVNGLITLDENLADNAGLDVATRAFFKLLEQTNPDNSSDEEKSSRQLFFISYAQTWCNEESSDSSPDVKKPHSPNKVRALGALRNSHAFSEAFDCPKTSQMNTEEKCQMF